MKEKIVLLLAKTQMGMDCYFYLVPKRGYAALLKPSSGILDITKYGRIIKSGYGLPPKAEQDFFYEHHGFDSSEIIDRTERMITEDDFIVF